MTDTKHEIRVGDEGRGKTLDQARDALVDGGKEADRVRDFKDARVLASYPFPLTAAVVIAMVGHWSHYPHAEVRLSKDKKSAEVWSHPKK